MGLVDGLFAIDEMESTDKSGHLFLAGKGAAGFDDVQGAAMRAGGEDHEAPIAFDRQSQLVAEVVRHLALVGLLDQEAVALRFGVTGGLVADGRDLVREPLASGQKPEAVAVLRLEAFRRADVAACSTAVGIIAGIEQALGQINRCLRKMAEEGIEPSGVVGMAMREEGVVDGRQVDAQQAGVLHETGGGAHVVEDAPMGGLDQERETVLREQGSVVAGGRVINQYGNADGVVHRSLFFRIPENEASSLAIGVSDGACYLYLS